jgi:hypothetical protein
MSSVAHPVAGCTGTGDQAPALLTPAPTTLETSAGPVSSDGGTGSGTVEDRAERSDQLLATMSPDQPGCSAAVASDRSSGPVPAAWPT